MKSITQKLKSFVTTILDPDDEPSSSDLERERIRRGVASEAADYVQSRRTESSKMGQSSSKEKDKKQRSADSGKGNRLNKVREMSHEIQYL